jgi:hypothetical protein
MKNVFQDFLIIFMDCEKTIKAEKGVGNIAD